MFVFQFTTIVNTSGKISLYVFQLVCHAYKMSSVYIWIPYSRTIFKYRTDKRLITSNMLMHYHLCDRESITFGNILGYYSHYVF